MVRKYIRPYQKSAAAITLIVILTLRSSEGVRKVPPQWVIWNIGQGSWITRIENETCRHFDAGGEGKFPFQVVRLCRSFKNSIAISHSDWDHISFIRQLHSEIPNLCREGPFDRPVSKWLADIPACKNVPWWHWRPPMNQRQKNDASSVYFYKNLLYPGDSPKKFEKNWWDHIPGGVSFLVLAHHGSRTGTSKKLLGKLPIKLAIASARQNKYGHPHKQVRANLISAGVPLVTTEAWGSIHILDH